MQQTFRVTLTATREHTYEIEANTSEEAESIAEVMYDEGEEGNDVGLSVDVSDVYPIEDNETSAT